MNQVYRTPAIASYFIKKSIKENNPLLTAMQVLKLVYVTHGYALAIKDNTLTNEPVEAWESGAIFPALYRDIKTCGTRLISEPLTDRDGEIYIFPHRLDKKIMDLVYRKYAVFSGAYLSELIHKKGTPWHNVWYEQKGSDTENKIIENDDIKKYYKKLLNINN